MVRRGQIVRVGRTAWADFSLSADASLSDVHFAVEYDRQGCRVRDLGSGSGTAVNGALVSEATLRSGDQILAGQTIFAVLIEDEAPLAGESLRAAPLAAVEEPPGVTPSPQAADYCRHVELSEAALEWLPDDATPLEYFDLLVTQELFADAIRFLAGWFPKTQAVRWGGSCLQKLTGGRVPENEVAALEAALTWSTEPNEEHRRAAQAVADLAAKKGPATWLATAAFWSGGSLAPPELPPAVPAEGLTAKAVTASLLLAVSRGDPLQAKDRYRTVLEEGRRLVTNSPA